MSQAFPPTEEEMSARLPYWLRQMKDWEETPEWLQALVSEEAALLADLERPLIGFPTGRNLSGQRQVTICLTGFGAPSDLLM